MMRRLLKIFSLLAVIMLFHSSLQLVKAQTQEDISSFLQQGQDCYNRGDLTGAALEFENILMIDRQNFAARVWLAQVYIDLKALDKARHILREAALQAPDHPRVIQLQKMLGEIKTPVSLLNIDPVKTEAIALLGSGTRLRRYGLVIPESKVASDTRERDLLVFDDIEIIDEKPKEPDLQLEDYFGEQSGPLADVFKVLEREGLNPALDMYFTRVFADPKLGAADDKGLLARAENLYSPRFKADQKDREAHYYFAALQYMNGMYPYAEELFAPLRKDPGEYAERMKPFLAGIDRWREQENLRVAMIKQAEEERLAREAAEKEEEERFRLAEEARSQRRRRPVDIASGAAQPTTPEGVAKGLHSEGYDLYKRGKLDEALEKYQAALEQHGENAELNYHMGLAWTDKGLAGDSAAFDRAVISFQRVISLVPDSKLAKDAQAMIRDIDSAKKTLGE
ncbi:MAG: tetratricopeptide repeat protein [Candidatus Riflebacteria bacterium]|nr:tetratricopeptide repeat protein [Candidatus Riflebacteria bacterium]